MQKGFSVILILVAVVILVAIAGGAFFLGRQTSPAQTISSPSPVPSQQVPVETPKQVSPSPVDETANWKTYTSTNANFSFKYPSEWPLVNIPKFDQCSVCIEGLTFSHNYNSNSSDLNIATILVFKEENIKSLDDYVKIHVKGDQSKVNLQYTNVGGEKAVSYKLSGGIPPLPVIEYAVFKNGLYYIIRLEDSVETNKNKSKNQELFDKMLSTFKFN